MLIFPSVNSAEQLLNDMLNKMVFTVFLAMVLSVQILMGAPSPTRLSPWDQGLRPGGSLDMPLIGLVEQPGRIYDPKPEDLDPKALRAKLGKHFDTRFMSVSKPSEAIMSPNGTIQFPFKRTRKGRLVPLGEMPRSLKKMNFNYIRLPDGSRVRTKVTGKLKKKLQQFLWAYTTCPTLFRWKDIGIRYWPRWIREGHCVGGHSCSVPPGMACKPSRSTTKMFLRWHCQDWERSKYCKWIPIRYPITTECSCSCGHGGGYT